ncbi:hypothetical protein D0864_07026 [Hortaea werneckii]|uniref:F-box domain-containing protein n=1 Tax=Hortaea werneckii TaxID=91943 RepID=A0A3M7FDW3_HORWE|nr:hypothetical protein D0864_07026 [Hortaea werneckii]
MGKTIIDLPSELITSIVTYLDPQDVFSLRLSAKTLEGASFAHFGKRFFHKKGYMLTSPSLAVLQHVANHIELKKFVQHVWFSPDCFTYRRPDCVPKGDDRIHSMSPGDHYFSLIENTACQLQKVLVVAFAKLPNLKILGMRRFRVGTLPWGWRRLKDAVGCDPGALGRVTTGSKSRLTTRTLLFVALINATSSSGITLRRLYTNAIELDNIRPDMLPQDALNKACNPIWYLEVDVTRGWLKARPNLRSVDYITPRHPKWEDGIGLRRLIQSCTSLKEIDLQILPDHEPPRTRPDLDVVEEFLESGPYQCFRNTINGLSMRSLDRIKLERVIASPTDLLAFLQPSAQTLTSLKLREVRLVSDDNPSRPWQPIFEFLHSSAHNLESILFHHLLSAHGALCFVRVIQPTPFADDEDGDGEADPSDSHFTDYGNNDITLQADSSGLGGKEGVRWRLGETIKRHYYQSGPWWRGRLPRYDMDDAVWHTDTSDEEW